LQTLDVLLVCKHKERLGANPQRGNCVSELDQEGGTGQAIGSLVVVLGMFMWLPAIVDLAHEQTEWPAFMLASGLTIFFGIMMVMSTWNTRYSSSPIRRAYFVTVGAWIFLCAFGSLPLLFCSLDLSIADAVFETVSGLTATGATVLYGLDDMPRGILFWRGLMQWIGGIGIIVMAIAILPMFRVGGMQMFQLESSEQSQDKLSPRVQSMAVKIAWVYLLLSLLCAFSYWLLGMTPFEALAHAMTTISTGGYSTSDSSIGYFNSAGIEWAGILYMLAGATPFVLFVMFLSGRGFSVFYQNSQVRRMLMIVGIAAAIVSLWLIIANDYDAGPAVRHALFNLVAVMTTTGYASSDYNLWGPPAVAIFFFMIFVGGCAGSTSGGLKMFRFEMLREDIRKEFRRLLYPNGVFPDRSQGRPTSASLVRDVQVFVLCYAFSAAVLVLVLAFYGLDFLTALSGAAAAVANVGPGLGDVIGPAGNYSSLPDGAKWALDIGMILGRLEFETVFVMMTVHFWRD